MTHLSFHRAARGSSLLFVVIMLAVLAIVGLAVITQANNEADGAAGKRQYDRSVACAEAAREMLNSQFRLYGVAPTSLTLNTTLDGKRLASGHYNNVAVTSVTAATGSSSGSMGVSDMANRIVRSALGGQLYRMTVVCSSPNTTRQSEIEFLVKFGL
jgi:Tfp pilus assembly protein PilX